MKKTWHDLFYLYLCNFELFWISFRCFIYDFYKMDLDGIVIFEFSFGNSYLVDLMEMNFKPLNYVSE